VTVYVALLGGINVGGRTLRSAALREIAEGCGFDDVSTFIQSGNVLFRSGTGAKVVGAHLHDGILEVSGIDTRVAMRTAAQLRAVVAANPFLDRSDDPTKLSVTFLFDGVEPTLSAVDPADYAPDEVVVIGREAYLHTPNGMGKTKLVPPIAKKLGLVGTTRNWRSTTKLAELAAGMGRT
jgi:uncharacterized protein (DUF1697 family)